MKDLKYLIKILWRSPVKLIAAVSLMSLAVLAAGFSVTMILPLIKGLNSGGEIDPAELPSFFLSFLQHCLVWHRSILSIR